MAGTSTIDGSKFAFSVVARISGAATQDGASLPAGSSPLPQVTVPTALARIPDGAINFTATPSTFLSDYNDIMGDAGADTDGFDDILVDAFLDIDADTAGFEALGDLLDVADFVDGAIDDELFAPLATSISAFNATGQTLYDTMSGALAPPGTTTNPAPPPPAPPAPPGGGGGGTGAGGGGGQIGGQPPQGIAGGGTHCTFVLNTDGITGNWVCVSTPPTGTPVHPPLQE